MPQESSPSESTQLALNANDWDNLSQLLDSFGQAWDRAPPIPELKNFLPSIDDQFRRIALTELIKLDLNHRAKQEDLWRSLEEYLAAWPEIGGDSDGDKIPIPLDLIFEEFQARVRANPQSQLLDEYKNRFPESFAALREMILEASGQTMAMFQATKPSSFEAGQTVEDFELVQRLGRGAFATVFLARQISMQRMVALKISADQGLEPQMLAQLDHPNIVRVYDQKTVPDLKIRLLYMQFVAGGSLQQVMRSAIKMAGVQRLTGKHFIEAVDKGLNEGGTDKVESEARSKIADADWATTVAIIGEQIANALDYAHSNDVLHRDLKPANILIAADLNAKLVDFNISHSTRLDGASATAYFGGSLAYMSPEQLEASSPQFKRDASDLDGRSDIYALGVVLYEMLVGHRPFSEPASVNWAQGVKSMIGLRRDGLTDDAEQDLKPYSGILGDTIQQCLHPAREFRCPNAANVAQKLKWCADRSVTALLDKTQGFWGNLFNKLPTICALGFAAVVSALTSWFIFTYNLIESVPEAAHGTFWGTQAVINGIAFSIGLGIIVISVRPISFVLGAMAKKQRIRPSDLSRAMKRALQVGLLIAVLATAEWIVAGILYPIVLSGAGAGLPASGWVDFIGSHLLAGLAAGAYTFWAITYVALNHWAPRILRAQLWPANEFISSASDYGEHGELVRGLSKQVSLFQVIGITAPLVAIALLVFWGDATNKFALAVLSVFALFGLLAIAWTTRKIRDSLAAYETLLSSSK